jgi:hypothetical protein
LVPIEFVKNPIPPPDVGSFKVLANNIPAPNEYFLYVVDIPVFLTAKAYEFKFLFRF